MAIKPFLDQNFLLENKTAEILYHDYASRQPIIDYHNHLSPRAIAEDISFKNITHAWLNGDHYKWRAMRTLGVEEKYITGIATDKEKFIKWAEIVPSTIRNPLFHWTHLELQRYFEIDNLLTADSAEMIYERSSALLQQSDYSTCNLLRGMNVELVCTTDDPIDNLAYHKKTSESALSPVMLMAYRPDKSINISAKEYTDYVKKLGEVANTNIIDFKSLISALLDRMDYFHNRGCRLSDHGLGSILCVDYTESEIDHIIAKRLKGKELNESEISKYQSAVLYELGCAYSERGWVQQFHLGVMRNNSTRMLDLLGPDTGFDSIGDFSQAASLSRYFNRLDGQDKLAKTVIYNLNPRDNEVFATMLGNFNDGSVRGKMQFGSAWWFLDQKDGMEKQINALSSMGILSCFIGMLTDSRSFLSFPRHEYFRRILCNLIGRDVHNGELPDDTKWLGKIVADICYNNAKNYFNF